MESALWPVIISRTVTVKCQKVGQQMCSISDTFELVFIATDSSIQCQHLTSVLVIY